MASFSDSSHQHAAPGAAAQATADEWYDQGFDLNDETQIFDYAQSGINPDLIPSAEQKLEASEYNQVRSDAQESLQSGNLKLDITQVGQIASGKTTHEHGPRRGAIMVGGQGKIEDIPLSLEVAREHEGIYTDEYKEKARKEEARASIAMPILSKRTTPSMKQASAGLIMLMPTMMNLPRACTTKAA